MHPLLIAVALVPLLFRLTPMLVPGHYLEPYAYWSPEVLNDGPTKTYWRNMGYWDMQGEETYPEAAAALAQKLIDFAKAPAGGSILDIAHGSGESLSLHLNSSTPPRYLDALTSIPSESVFAENLIKSRHPKVATEINFFTASASYRPAKDLQHPLNPMRGFMGERSQDDDDDESMEPKAGPPPPYDFVYILDAIYHFQPAVPHFLTSVYQVLRPGEGVVAYTDILPPPDLSPLMGHLVLPPLLSVPARNLVSRPKTLEEYATLLEKIGYVDVEIEDWSPHVWKGFAANLRPRGRVWSLVSRAIEGAERAGWRFVAVRATRPAIKMTA